MIRLVRLTEDIDAVRKYYPNIDAETFDKLIALDPTFRGKQSLGKYGKWILNLYNRGQLSDEDIADIPNVLQLFTTYKNRLDTTDLNRFKSVQELSDAIADVAEDESMLTPRQRVRFHKRQKAGKIVTDARDDYDIVFENSNYIVYVPHTHEASMYLGQGTEWCTAHENPYHYNDYTEGGFELYIIKDKRNGNRWQWSTKTGDFLDQYDEEFDRNSILMDNQLYGFLRKVADSVGNTENDTYFSDLDSDDQDEFIWDAVHNQYMEYIFDNYLDWCRDEDEEPYCNFLSEEFAAAVMYEVNPRITCDILLGKGASQVNETLQHWNEWIYGSLLDFASIHEHLSY